MADVGLSGLVNGILANDSYKKYASMLDSMQAGIPNSILNAENIAKSQANTGLVNYEQNKQDIADQLPETLGAMRDSLTGGQLIGVLGNLHAKQLDSMRGLDQAQANALFDAKANFGNFESGVKAPAEIANKSYNDQLKMGAEQARMEGKSQEMQGFSSFIDPANSLASGMLGKGNNASKIASLFASKPTQQQSTPWRTSGSTGAYSQGAIASGPSESEPSALMGQSGGGLVSDTSGAGGIGGFIGKILPMVMGAL